ncbi:MAG TPA: branched-chain amino acid ABC transporter permease [Alphaproteobacteria bacterium]|nr:branched-chain amino acid ABC transporter permease [Alphaproteobacteria bacterium]
MTEIALLVQGLLDGSIYALIAVGLTLVYGLLRILHVAHAGLFTLGGYVGVVVTNQTGSFVLALVVAMVVAGIVGMIIYRLVYQPILHLPPYVALIASIGLFIAMQEGFRFYDEQGVSFVDAPLQGTVAFAGQNLQIAKIVTFFGAIILIGGLGFLAARTRTGVAWRATVTKPKMAESFGINIVRVRYLNFFIGSALAAVAGVMVSLTTNLVEPTSGDVWSYKALAIIVLGGLGSMRGTLIACFALGVIEAYGTTSFLGAIMNRDAIAFAFLVVVLMIRPQGLFVRT